MLGQVIEIGGIGEALHELREVSDEPRNRGTARGLVRTDLELELKARKAAVAGNVVGSVGRGHGGL